MRNSYLFGIVLAGGLMAYGLPSRGADTHAKDRQQITAAYRRMNAAFQAKDADASVVPLATDYVSIGPDGRERVHSKIEERDNWAGVFAKLVDGTDTTTVDNITFTRDGATVDGTDDGSGHVLVKGRAHVLSHHSTYRDFWIKSGNTWLEKRSRTLTRQLTADGQPVP